MTTLNLSLLYLIYAFTQSAVISQASEDQRYRSASMFLSCMLVAPILTVAAVIGVVRRSLSVFKVHTDTIRK